YLHDLIWKKIESYYQVNKNEKLVAVEVPLLFETDWYRRFDCNILVTCNDRTVIERLKSTRNMSEENAITVLNNQLSDDAKRDMADVIIENDSTVSKLKESVNRRVNDIINSLPKD
ncbi:MAG: dephospho-CoA kinase, partial [Erysipelotrichaceae bacterium]|nr:dephospho-CoA kinase [Erysipelotrichaceae bacterium]